MRALDFILTRKLPAEYRDSVSNLDVKGVEDLMARVARERPDDFPRISKLLMDLGRRAVYEQGETLTLDDMRPVIDTNAYFQRMENEIKALKKDLGPGPEFEKAREKLWVKYADDLEKISMQEGLKKGTNLAYAVASGARGKPAQFKAMVSSPGIYGGHFGKTIPIFIKHSLGQGLRPAEYLASTFGARASVVSTKRSTAQGGDWGKQLAATAAHLVVGEDDCGTTNGIDLSPEEDLRGRVLARPVAGYPAGTIVDRDAQAAIRRAKPSAVLVRSAITCSAKNGLCAHCVGADARGILPPLGEMVGITSAHAVSEPVIQGSLNSKHTSGQVSGRARFTGLKYLTQFSQAPETFPDRTAVAELDGKVSEIKPAPQGGTIVVINDQEHYVLPDQEVKVKAGDTVEAGDELSDGLTNPTDVVRLRGLGEGRRYWADRLKEMLDDGGVKTDRRHTEVLARAAINHVVVDDDADPSLGIDALPDDVVSYDRVARSYTPPVSTKLTKVSDEKARGKYLAAPALHYSIGTRLTPKIADRLSKVGIVDVAVQDTPPPFSPDVIRLRTATHAGDDWLAKMHTSYVAKGIADSLTRGDDTNILENTHYVPRLAYGVGFGSKVRETGKF